MCPGLGPALRDIAQLACQFSINLDGQVERHESRFRGGFAVVYRGTLRPQGLVVAVKVVAGAPPSDKRAAQAVLREVHTWSKLHHRNVLPLLGITTDFDYTISIVSAWMEKGNAHDYVQDPAVDPRPLVDGIAQGLQYLHNYKPGSIFHGDLKGANVLISQEGYPLLTDFGLSYVVNSSLKMSRPQSVGGSVPWMAPDIWEAGKPTATGDVWAFGMTTLELFSRKVPFHQCWGLPHVITRIMRGPPERPSMNDTESRLTDDWWNLCCSCWDFNPSLRPSMSYLVNKISYLLVHESKQPVFTQQTKQLSPTTQELLNVCPRFRILVIGKTGVGKSTLINRAFGIEEAVVSSGKRGYANIDKELTSDQNDCFILHDSCGLEPGERENYGAVESFIQHRRSHADIKEQLHAIWFCFQIPLVEYGERLMERGMEDILKKKHQVFGNVPTIFVFTKYDKLIDQIEGTCDDDTDVELQAKEYLKKYCIKPIQSLTKEQNIPHIAVTMRRGFEVTHEKLIELTFQKVSERFTPQLDQPSPVPVVTMIAQRVAPSLKIEGSIQVGKRRYWKALASSPNFFGYTIWNCLGVIHTDIVSVWNFHDPSGHLTSKEFQGLMTKMVRDIDDQDASPQAPSIHPVVQNQQHTRSSVPAALRPIKLPYEAGLAFVNWVYNTYQQLPVVQQIFMAYIVDLAHVLKILFALIAGNSEKKLTRRPIKIAFNLYNESEFRRYVHTEVKKFTQSVGGRDVILERIESLVRRDNGLSQLSMPISSADLDEDEPWHTSDDCL